MNEQIVSNHRRSKYECTECDLEFNFEEELKNHNLKEHTVSRNSKERYPCEKCLYVFNSEESYTIHLSGKEHNLRKIDDYSNDSEDEDYSDKCRFCGAVFTTYESFDNHQDSYLQCEKCNICFHNEFQWKEHEKCDPARF